MPAIYLKETDLGHPDVLLLNPPGKWIRTGRLVRESKTGTQGWPPIFLATATGVLEKLGYDCILHDASILGESEAETLSLIRGWRPGAIAYYWAYDTRAADLAFAEVLAREFRVILVGPWSAHYPEALRDCPGVEAVTFGPFEYTLPKLIERTRAEGVTYRGGEHVPQGEPYTRAELDWMPYVTEVYKRYLPIERYHQTSLRHPFVDLFTGTPGSCPHRCAFCSWTNGYLQLHPQRWRTRSLGMVMDELWWVKENLPGVRQVFFQDSTLPTPWGLEISQRIIDEGLKLCWGCYSRPDKTYEEIVKFKVAGCRTFHVGYECPDAGILSEIKKDISVEQMTRFAKDMERVGMWQSMSLMIFPWMTPGQIRYMVEWAREMNPTRINVARLQAYPNTPIMDVLKSYRDFPGFKLMDDAEMTRWERYCFREFYVKNPRFWANVLMNPGELKQVVGDAWGMLRFLAG